MFISPIWHLTVKHMAMVMMSLQKGCLHHGESRRCVIETNTFDLNIRLNSLRHHMQYIYIYYIYYIYIYICIYIYMDKPLQRRAALQPIHPDSFAFLTPNRSTAPVNPSPRHSGAAPRIGEKMGWRTSGWRRWVLFGTVPK